jgi:hypothetical protein
LWQRRRRGSGAAGGDRKSEEYQKSVVELVPQPIEENNKARDEVGRISKIGSGIGS